MSRELRWYSIEGIFVELADVVASTRLSLQESGFNPRAGTNYCRICKKVFVPCLVPWYSWGLVVGIRAMCCVRCYLFIY